MTDLLDDSRRLTGANPWFDGTGAALEALPASRPDDAALARWRANVHHLRTALGWPDGAIVARPHAGGASLAFVAPADVLYTATEANEWAWLRAVAEGGIDVAAQVAALAADAAGDDGTPGTVVAGLDDAAAMALLRERAAAEAKPRLAALRDAARAHGLAFLADDDAVSIGAGRWSQGWPAAALPDPSTVDWGALRAIPTALVTGSNGKTTTVRLVAAMLRAQGLHVAHSCTDGVFVDGEAVESGDFSGPTGARTALRDPRIEAAVLETARGGLLRRGLALERADVAVVTNVSPDHYGEYGVHGLEDLARAKLAVGRAVAHDGGLLVLNAGDANLRALAPAGQRLAWFAMDDGDAFLAAHRGGGGATCGVAGGHLQLHDGDASHDLGDIAAMPLSLAGRAGYNVQNMMAAALAAHALGVAPATIASLLARFGGTATDNPGRLQHWTPGGIDVFLDYAHNPDGLAGFLRAIGADAREARLAVLLGHAGNRSDDELRAVAGTVAGFAPDLVVLKDIGGYERGRAAGEVGAVMRDALLAAGVPADSIEVELAEVAAALRTLAWARAGDLVALPVHDPAARIRVAAALDTLQRDGWHAGAPLPAFPTTDPA